MKTSLEKTSGLGRKLTIEVPADKVSSTFDKVYKGLQKNANIKGFRQGKAPMNMIKNLYADRVKQDVLENLVSEAYNHALTEHALRPISDPNVNFDALDEDRTFNFTAEFEVRPEVTLKKIEKLKIEKEKLDVSDEKAESILLQIRESRAATVPVLEDRPAKDGDILEIDFTGTVDNQPLEGGSMNGYKLVLGSNTFIPGFETGLLGLKPGAQKTLNLQFPEDYGHKAIAGKPVKFEVTVKAILKKDVPALTDDFVKSLGGYNTVEELKNVILQDVTEQETRRIQEELKNRVLKALVSENPVEVPQAMRERQIEFLQADVKKRMQQQGMNDADFEDYKAKWQKDFEETADFMIQSSFLIDAIAEKQKITATAQELDDRLEKYAKQSGVEVAKLREFYMNNHDRKHQMKYQITEEKVVDFLIQNADVKEVPREKLAKTE